MSSSIHHTETDVTEDEAAHIQDVFRAISQDDRRVPNRSAKTSMSLVPGAGPAWCSPSAPSTSTRSSPGCRRSATRRSCCAAGSARVPARLSRDAIAARDPDDGIVLVATGSYLGEGFDWPELDTLFLAFPLAFKGRVVQYVGRLLRAHEGKHHVELHDYVDSRIPVLDRMHAKRLPAYTTLGFDVPSTRQRRTSAKTRAETGTEPA